MPALYWLKGETVDGEDASLIVAAEGAREALSYYRAHAPTESWDVVVDPTVHLIPGAVSITSGPIPWGLIYS